MEQGYKKSNAVRQALLDNAETLFAERGYFGTSVRDITNSAGLRNAAVNYHFETKEKLFMAVIDRRIEPLASARLERLRKVTVNPDNPASTVRQIAKAFSVPMLDLAANEGSGWRNYCRLVAHLAVQNFWSENTVSEKYDSHSSRFLDALLNTFPDSDPYRIHCCFQFLLSTTLYAVCDNKRMDTLSSGLYKSAGLAKLQAPFLDFVTGGIMSTALT